MRSIIFASPGLLAVLLSCVQAAPVPKHTTPRAIINANTEKNMTGVLENVVWGARVGVRENDKVANLDIIRHQKDWEAWLKKNLRVERAPGTTLVYVRFRDGTPEDQAAIINVVVDYYLTNTVKERRDALTKMTKDSRDLNADLLRQRKISKATFVEVEERNKKREEYIQTLPALVEHAKPR